MARAKFIREGMSISLEIVLHESGEGVQAIVVVLT